MTRSAPAVTSITLLHILRSDPSFVPELDVVAVQDGRIVGHIAYTKSTVTLPDGGLLPTLMFGPISVAPDHQKCGIGARLIYHTLDAARPDGIPSRDHPRPPRRIIRGSVFVRHGISA